MCRTKLRLDFTDGGYPPDKTAFELFLNRWLALAEKIEKGFTFKFDWERLIWELRLNIGKPDQKGACATPIAILKVDLMRSDQLIEGGLTPKPNSISQAFCRDITFVPYESRLKGKTFKKLGSLVKEVLASLEKTRY